MFNIISNFNMLNTHYK